MKETTASLLEQLQIETFHCAGQAFQSTMRLSPFHAQPFGFVNGGVYLAYGEALAGMASNAILAQELTSNKDNIDLDSAKEKVAVGQSITANHVRPKRCNGYVVARGQLLHKGGRNHVWTINIFDEEDQLLSHMTVTNSIINL
ncbi:MULTISPECIES: PaaI family thioesterase [unclassified Veillonella]|uniref:PaaI family thioesterase n=1 Tax=unclassified Veillonella TaxID=2630086 RepID=UPI000F8C6296|nr:MULTISPECIES: PaaI family thioesterase [unclassified Veillonella]